MSFTPVRITTLKSDREIPFSVFIFFQEQYLEYVKGNQAIPAEKFKKLRKQKITKFYIKDHDEEKYQNFLDSLLNDVLADPTASVDKKVELSTGAAQTAAHQMNDNPESESAYNVTKSASKGLCKVVLENPEALNKIFSSEMGEDEVIIKHSLNVCAMSIKLAELQELEQDDIENLATAALMHDCGLSKVDEETRQLFKKSKSEYSADEKVKYFAHCRDALFILKEKDYINKQIMQWVENHEENLSGSGPNKLKKLEKAEEILSLVNVYDKLVTVDRKSPTDAVQSLLLSEMGNYDLALIKDLQKLVKIEGL